MTTRCPATGRECPTPGKCSEPAGCVFRHKVVNMLKPVGKCKECVAQGRPCYGACGSSTAPRYVIAVIDDTHPQGISLEQWQELK